MQSGRNKGEPDYYGSLERLPLAPVRGKPPPYASRRQQGSRRGNLLKGNRVISSSTGDLSSRSRTTSGSSNEGDGEDWGGGNGGGGDLGIPVMSGDLSDAPTAMPAHHQHQRHVSVSYSYAEHPSEDHITFTATPTPQTQHQRHGSVSFSLVYITDDSDEKDESGSNTDSPDTSLQPKIQEQGYSRREQGLTHNKTQLEEKQGTRNMAQDNRTQEQGYSRSKQGLSHNKTQEEEKQGTRNMAQDNRTQEQRHSGKEQSLIQNKAQEKQKEEGKKPQERLRSGTGDAKDSDATSPVNTTEGRPRSGSTSNINSLKKYRELAAIPDHTLVKWERSKSMNDVTGDDDAKDSGKERKGEGEMKRAQSFDSKHSEDCEKKNEKEMRGRERYPSANDAKEERNTSVRRHVASYNDTKDAGDMEKKNERNTRGREKYSSANDDMEERNTSVRRHVARYNDTKDAGDAEKKSKREKRYTERYSSTNDVKEERNMSVRRRVASYNDAKDAGDAEKKNEREMRARERYSNANDDAVAKDKRSEETRHFARHLLATSKTEDETESVREGKGTMQRGHHVVTSPSSSSSSSSSNSPSHSPRQSVQEGGRGSNAGDGVFVATPVFLEGSPSSTPPPSIPTPSTGHQGGLLRGAGQDSLTRERDSALSTLRKEIQHLTRLKEEIEQNLIKSQTRLQRQASDLQEQLREERRYRQEETKQLRREVRALTSRLQEKEQQLAKYKSDPTLSSWGSEVLEKGTVGSWKTSLPDVRKELSPTSLGASVAERRRSFSSMSDCSDDSRFSTAGSFVFRKARAKEDASGRSNESAGRPYKAVETSGKPNVAPVNDSRSRTSALSSGKFDKAPAGETRPRGVSARLDKTVESSGKPNIAAVSHSRLNEAPTRSSITMGLSGKTAKAPAGETRPWRAPAKPDSEAQVLRSNIAAKDYSVPLRLETAVESSRTPNREHASQSEPDVYHIGSRKPLVTSGNVASLDLLPSSLTVPLGDTILSDTADSQRFESGDSGRTRVKTAVYMELGDYTRPGVQGGGGRGEGEHLRTGNRGPRAGVFEGGRGEGEFMRTGDRGLGAGVYEGVGTGEGEYLRAGNRGFGAGVYEGGRGGGEREHLRAGNRGLGGGQEGDYAKRGGYERGLSEGNYERREGGQERRYEPGHKERNHARLGGVDGNYGRPGRGRGGSYETGLEGNHARPGGGAEVAYEAGQKDRNSVRSESYEQEIKRKSQNPVTKSAVPPQVPYHHTTSSGQPPHMSRPVTTPPQPPQFTRTPTLPPQASGTSQVTKQTPQPSQQVTRSFAVPSQGKVEGQARLPGDVEYGRRNEHRGVDNERRETELPRIVGYIRKTGVQRGVEDGRREAELDREMEYGGKTETGVQRGLENGRRDAELKRGVEHGRMTEAGIQRGLGDGRRDAEVDRRMEYGRKAEAGVQSGLENGRRDAELERGVEYGRKTDAGVQKRVADVRRGTEIARGEEHGRKTDRDRPRVENVRRDTEIARGEEYRRQTNPGRQKEVRIGRRETPLARVEEYRGTNDSDRPRSVENERWNNQKAQREVDVKRNQDSELTGGSVRVSEAGNVTPNTSYITATVLCLYNLPYLRHFFTTEFLGLGVRSDVARAVSGVFSALESGAKDGRALHHLREAVGRRDKTFQLHQDPAAADFLSCLLVWLHDDLTPEEHKLGPSAAASVVSRTFHGLRESLITCPMRGEVLSAAMEFVNIIRLSVPGEGAWTLQELLARRFQAQEMAWECRLCGRRHPCTHQLRFLQPPRVLLLYLWRSSVGAVSARVLFPEGGLALNLHHHHQHQQKDRILRSREYHLVGVVTREAGNGSSTHSAFYRRLEGAGGWQAWREQRVAAVSRREVLSQQSAHLLFYVQQEGESQQASGSSRGRGEARRGGTRGGGMPGTCV